MINAAIEYSLRGWPVLPLHSVINGKCTCSKAQNCSSPGKHPLIPNGVLGASTETEKIQEWWSSWPSANVGIATGAGSQFVVLDVDEGGDESLRELEVKYGSLPSTPKALTGGGGYHLLFKAPKRSIRNKVALAKGLDFRGDGGYIVAPPSRHFSGKSYNWSIDEHPDDVVLADLPNWLENLLSSNGTQTSVPMSPIVQGTRNTTLTQIAGAMRRKGTGFETIVLALQSENKRCIPPLEESEIVSIARSISKYPPASDIVQRSKSLELKAFNTFLDEPDEETAWIVTDLLPAGGVSVLAGKPKAGKTTLARCLLHSLAVGEEFLGRTVVKCKTMYFALEEKSGEVKKHFKTMGTPAESDLMVYVARAPQNPLEELARVIKEHNAKLVVVDPLFRFIRVPDANDYAKVSASFEPIVEAARETGCHLLFVHHMGKGQRSGGDAILGSSAIYAAVDTAILLVRTENYRTISSTQRYGTDLTESTLTWDEESRKLSLGPTRENAEVDRISREILAIIKGSSQPLTQTQIETSVEGGTKYKRKALKALLGQQVEREGSGKKGDPFVYRVKEMPNACFLVPDISAEQGNNLC